jgi:hypothetical protein
VYQVCIYVSLWRRKSLFLPVWREAYTFNCRLFLLSLLYIGQSCFWCVIKKNMFVYLFVYLLGRVTHNGGHLLKCLSRLVHPFCICLKRDVAICDNLVILDRIHLLSYRLTKVPLETTDLQVGKIFFI